MSQNPNSGNGNAAQGSNGQQSQQHTAQGQQGQPAQQGGGQGAPQNQPQQGRTQQPPRSTTEEVGSWFTETLVRAGILVIGVAVMLFAIGQAVGLRLLEPMAEFFTSGTGAWFVVAFLALLVMIAATKSWRTVN
ncbi:hypothetical protein [Halomarina oriensis]|uniref:Uncharacterized protein n=1 Tax=Halomarina oriensis TaxID=671145 RepID=A0A6B0GIE7_9EURY|nr:hypothetical protein [Halomarina oriensis]MWG33219.1 hypothetical protein [Halomarina oriensis]